jgi:hypothetical protein
MATYVGSYEIQLSGQVKLLKIVPYIVKATGAKVTENFGYDGDDTVWTGHKLNGPQVFVLNPHAGDVIGGIRGQLTDKLILKVTEFSNPIDLAALTLGLEQLKEVA